MEQPIMRQALGARWANLGDAVRAHYGITPGIAERRVMEGEMEVRFAPWAIPLLWMGRMFGALVVRQGKKIPVRVINWTEPGSAAMHWHRTLSYPGVAPHVFRSRMEHSRDDEIIEYVRFGLGIRMRITEHEGALSYEGLDYRWNLGPVRISIPDWLILGKARIREWAVDDKRFAMSFEIRHPLFGPAFSYSGLFQLLPCDEKTSTRRTALMSSLERS